MRDGIPGLGFEAPARRMAMALSYTIDESQRLITITGEYANAAEWYDVLSRVLGDPRRGPRFAVLRDQREGTVPVNAATVVAIMEVVRRFWPELGLRRAAILMPREADPPALVAHAIADEQDIPIRAFTSHDAAMEWLRGDESQERRAPNLGGTLTARMTRRIHAASGRVFDACLSELTGRARTYLEQERPRRLVFIPVGSGSAASCVTIDIVPLGDECELTLTHEGVPTDAGGADLGWSAMLDRIEGHGAGTRG